MTDDKRNMSEILKSIENKFDERANKLKDDFVQCLTNYKTNFHEEFGALANQIKNLVEENKALDERVDYLERESKSCEITISDIPFAEGENIKSIVANILKLFECDLDMSAIINCFRIQTQNVIILKFMSPEHKFKFMVQYFKHREINLSHLGFQSDLPFYCNERLTQRNAKIFKKARQYKNDGKLSKV